MSNFEKALINELKGIRKELQKMNNKEVKITADGFAEALHGATISEYTPLSRR